MAHELLTRLILSLTITSVLAELSLVDSKLGFISLKSSTGRRPPLRMPEDYPLDPLPDDINPTELIKELGDDYDPEYTARTFAEVLLRKMNETQQEDDYNYRKSLVQSMPEELRELDFTMPGDGRNLGPKASRKLQLWLWKLSSCSVISKWKDSGVRYWPRYRNHGRCSKKVTCSFPSGMRCKRSQTKKVSQLRWICNRTLLKKLEKSCAWIKVKSSVITKCSCQCSRREGRV